APTAASRCSPCPRAAGSPRRSRRQLLTDELVDDLRIGLALRLLHHLADEEAEQALLAAAEGLDLAGVRGQDPLDERSELGGVGDRLLGQVLVGGAAGSGGG